MEVVVNRLSTRMNRDHEVDGLKKRNLYDAFVEFAHAYNTFKNQQNIDNWKNAKDKQRIVLNIAKNPDLTQFMNTIWTYSPEFDDIHQNVWIHSELDRLNAPAYERLNPYGYIKKREEEEERRRREEEVKKEDEENIEKYATPPAAGGSFKLSKKLKKHSKKSKKHSKKHSKKSRKSKSRRH